MIALLLFFSLAFLKSSAYAHPPDHLVLPITDPVKVLPEDIFNLVLENLGAESLNLRKVNREWKKKVERAKFYRTFSHLNKSVMDLKKEIHNRVKNGADLSAIQWIIGKTAKGPLTQITAVLELARKNQNIPGNVFLVRSLEELRKDLIEFLISQLVAKRPTGFWGRLKGNYMRHDPDRDCFSLISNYPLNESQCHSIFDMVIASDKDDLVADTILNLIKHSSCSNDTIADMVYRTLSMSNSETLMEATVALVKSGKLNSQDTKKIEDHLSRYPLEFQMEFRSRTLPENEFTPQRLELISSLDQLENERPSTEKVLVHLLKYKTLYSNELKAILDKINDLAIPTSLHPAPILLLARHPNSSPLQREIFDQVIRGRYHWTVQNKVFSALLKRKDLDPSIRKGIFQFVIKTDHLSEYEFLSVLNTLAKSQDSPFEVTTSEAWENGEFVKGIEALSPVKKAAIFSGIIERSHPSTALIEKMIDKLNTGDLNLDSEVLAKISWSPYLTENSRKRLEERLRLVWEHVVYNDMQLLLSNPKLSEDFLSFILEWSLNYSSIGLASSVFQNPAIPENFQERFLNNILKSDILSVRRRLLGLLRNPNLAPSIYRKLENLGPELAIYSPELLYYLDLRRETFEQ